MISEKETTAIKVKQNYCSKCGICWSVCPFEAISLDRDKGEVGINTEKCQVCGICASACPSSAIQIAYYNYESLIGYVKEQAEALRTGTLALMCRGSGSPLCGILDTLKEQGEEKFAFLRLPCVGRLSLEFYLKAISIGIDKIIIVQCDEDSCRYKKGGVINIRKVQALRALLKYFGYEDDILRIVKNPSKALYETEKCVGCDKCVFICPFDAIEAQPLGTPEIKLEACKGCGACALVCPHLAIQLKGFEYEPSSQAIQKYMAEAALKTNVSPLVLVFCCQWAEFSALDRVRDGFVRENAVIAEIPCLDGLDPVHVLRALRSGFDGVLAIGCPEEDCKCKEGREVAERNISALEKVLDKLGLGGRFEVYKTSPRYLDAFDSKLDSFIARISSLAKSQ